MLTAALLAALAAGGCGGPGAPTGKPTLPEAHPTEGPHHGPLAEWGDEEYHAEFTVDRGKKQATVYILDEAVKNARPIAAESITLALKNTTPPVTVTLKAEPMEGEAKGTSSRFVGTNDALGAETAFEGEISGKVGGTPYRGKFKEEKHDDKKK
jgi:hypothetical protein